MRSVKKTLLKGSACLPLIALALSGCASVETGQVVKPGDKVGVRFTCRLPNGDLAASTDSQENESNTAKSVIFVKRTIDTPVTLTAGEVKRSTGIKGQLYFEDEIIRLLGLKTIGMRSGEESLIELDSQRCEGLPRNEEFISIARVRRFSKEMRLKVTDYTKKTGKAPEKGQPYVIDPAVPGSVADINGDEVLIRFAGQKGKAFTTVFGNGVMQETDSEYVMPIEAKTGTLVRTSGLIGRIVSVDKSSIEIDYGHPFGGEKLNCNVRVTSVETPPEGPVRKETATPHTEKAGRPLSENEKEKIRAKVTAALEEAAKTGKTKVDVFLDDPGTVESGDLVKVRYTASLEDGAIFATNSEQDAKDPSRKKAPSFAKPDIFADEEIRAGKQELLPGLGEAVVGMKPGEKKQIKLKPENAYGPTDPQKQVKLPCVMTFPLVIQMSADEYVKRFSSFPVLNREVDLVPYFKAQVKEVNEKNVVLKFLAKGGESYNDSYGTVKVSLNGEEITTTLTPVLGAAFPIKEEMGVIVGSDGKSFTVDYNNPLAGKTILLDLEVLSLTKVASLQTKPIDWIEEHDAGLARAKKEGKPVFLLLYADWCGWCKKTLTETIPDPRISGLKDKFVWVKVNSDKEIKYKEQYGQNGFPFIVLLKPDGTVLKKIDGYRDARALKAELNGVL
jgi:FKBP-type peptidyl-prolyl cis-trans isomerase 2